MRKIPEWLKAFCALLCISSLLLAGCASHPGDQSENQPTNSTPPTPTSPTTPTSDTIFLKRD